MNPVNTNIYDPQYIRGLFNSMSGSYERVNYLTSFGFSLRWRRQFLNSFRPPPGRAEIIDLMTGMGETWSGISRKLPNAHITVVDISEGMLKYAIRKNARQFNGAITILQQNILDNQLPAAHYDFVTCAFGLKTFNDQQIGILAQQTKRILKPGGQFSFIEVSKPGNRLLRALYGFYVGRIIPVFGWLLLGNPGEYKMLWAYTSRFGNAAAAADIFAKAGLEVEYKSYFWGCATGFCGHKPMLSYNIS